jgi:hypothetical protein
MKTISAFLFVIGCFNELMGFLSFIGANGAIQQIAGICMMILGTLQFILAKMMWPKE